MITFKPTVVQGSLLVLCLTAVFVYSLSFTDPYIVPKWLFVILITLGMGLYISIRILLRKPVVMDLPLVGISIVGICCLQALYGLLQYFNVFSSNSVYPITGSFDNPAGFAITLSAGFPFIGFLIQKSNHKYIQYLGWTIGIILLVAVFLSGSRAGIVSIVAICTIFFYSRFICKGIWNYLLSGGLILLLVCSYWMKKDSADGRMLIWQCGINMVKESPWIGHGIGSFEAHYMDYQAQFFHRNPDSGYAILADTVQQPFNEFLRIAVDYGLGGLLGLLGMIVFLILCYQKCNSCYKDLAALSLCSITVFSLFSYPFLYPFTWAVVLLDLVILAGNTWHIHWKIFSVVGKWLVILCVMGSLCITNTMVIRVKAEMKWKHALSLSSCGLFEKAQPLYDAAERVLGNDRYFLYNYAAELNVARFYKESLDIAMKCRHLWSDYDLEMLIAQNCWEINRMVEAEEYFRLASDMCPNRFMPLYRLVWLLDRQGRQTEARELATIIISKPVKIPSVIIERIKREMENYLTLKI